MPAYPEVCEEVNITARILEKESREVYDTPAYNDETIVC